ncbi:13418_t:CDS:2 [Ambispora gerdemannii]|uniref:13418_t:CDS:1 n=1 Tax=Ambispora gerdemannii TaxID=144530 RepID=A0A9N9D979_9GLOM|nr:13418_t:CDS:2 [Ambispora gerdemannii]
MIFGLIEKLHNNDLQTKDIFLVLNSVSSKYIYKPDVYNAVSCQRNIATKAAHNDERDQEGVFIQAIFWTYHSAISELLIAKDVLLIDATYKTNRFSMPLITIYSIDHFRSTYPLAFAFVYLETYDFYYWVMQQLSRDSTDVDLEELRLICLRFAFELFVKQQGDLAKLAKYEVLEYEENLMKHTSEYVLETGKVLKLLQSESNIVQQKILKMISIDNATNSDNIEMFKGKHTRDCSSNNRHIHGTEEKENKVSLKKRKTDNDMMLHLADIKSDPRISQNLILQVYNPIEDNNCGFRLLVMAIFKNEECWQDIKNKMRFYLIK